MEVKIYKNLNLRIIALFLALFLAIIPFFQSKKVNANPLVLGGLIAGITVGLAAVGYTHYNVAYTPEQMTQINQKWTDNLKQAFPDPKDYNNSMNTLQNINQKLINGETVDWGKYPGKVIYPVLKGIIDVVWPDKTPPPLADYEKVWAFLSDGKTIIYKTTILNTPVDLTVLNPKMIVNSPDYVLFSLGTLSYYNISPGNTLNCYFYYKDDSGKSLFNEYWFNGYMPSPVDKEKQLQTVSSPTYWKGYIMAFWKSIFLGTYGNMQFVPSIQDATANKITIPTRLPQTIINNINNYNGTENLIIAPTEDDLKDIPRQDVTPDQPGTTDPEPTPTPSPEPTPEPTPTPPDYNGDKWVNPIGDFMDGLLKFMKAAFVPTLSLNLDALGTMPDNLAEKFPFSLPGDLVRMFSIFQAEPKPFAFDWELDFTAVGVGKIPIKGDISMFDEYAPLFRNLAFIGFLIGLAWRTFGMFFGGGDE